MIFSFFDSCIFLLAFVAPTFNTAAAAYTPPAGWTQQLDAFIQHAVECNQIVGLTINIVYQNQSVYAKGFGVTSQEGGSPVDENTLFSIGSTTKAFTSTLIGMLIDEYPQSFPRQWDTKVHQIATDFGFVYPEQTKYMSIRDLLSMRSGVSTQFMMEYKNDTRHNIVYEYQYAQPAFEMRDTFLYHNWMITLAGELTEYVTGETWEEMIQERILTPLGMSSSSPYISAMLESENAASPYFMDPNTGNIVPLPNDINLNDQKCAPAGTIVLNANDSTAWLMLHLNGGYSLQTNTSLISSTRIAECHSASFLLGYTLIGAVEPTVPFSNVNVGYGFGWMHDRFQGHDVYWHNGDVYGFLSEMIVMPLDGLGIFMSMTGSTQGETPLILIRWYIQNLLLGLHQFVHGGCPRDSLHETVAKMHQPTHSKRKPKPVFGVTSLLSTDHLTRQLNKESMQSAAPRSLDVSIYVGTYSAPMYDELTITDASKNDRTMQFFSDIQSANIQLILTWQNLTIGLAPSDNSGIWFDIYWPYPMNITIGPSPWPNSTCFEIVQGVPVGFLWDVDQYQPPFFNRTQ